MQVQWNQTNQFQQLNNQFVNNTHKTKEGQSLLTRRRMLEAQEQTKETDAVKMTISGEAMELSRKVREMERAQQEQEVAQIPSELAEEDLYDELVLQVRIWGDATANIRNQYDHEETKELAEKRAAALTELQKLEQLQKSEISKQEKEAQKAAELAAVQQEEVNRKSSELIMMIESFEEQENDEEQSEKESDQKDTQETKTNSSLMEGKIGASAARRELGMLGTISQMEESGEYNLMTNIESVNGLLDERNNIYKMNNEPSIGIQEKIKAMSDYVAALVNPEMMQQYFDERIGAESDENTRKKLSMMYGYFMSLDMKNGIENLSKDRAHALQEKRNAKDLRIAHIGSRHLVMAEQQKKELQSLFDADDILRAQGQGSVASHTKEVTERLQEKLDERDRVDVENGESAKEEAIEETIKETTKETIKETIQTIEEILSQKEQLAEEEKRQHNKRGL